MIHNLFPTPVGRYELGRDLTAKELSFLKKQETRNNMGNTTSIDNTILKAKELTQLRDFIETKVSEYFTTVYSPKHKVNLKITQSWTNYTEQGQYHHKHEQAKPETTKVTATTTTTTTNNYRQLQDSASPASAPKMALGGLSAARIRCC